MSITKRAKLDRAFWLIILETWTLEEVEAWGEFAERCE